MEFLTSLSVIAGSSVIVSHMIGNFIASQEADNDNPPYDGKLGQFSKEAHNEKIFTE